MAKSKSVGNNFESTPQRIECEDLEPIRIVVRELEGPDGSTMKVEVPVYPPFQLKPRKTRARSVEPEESAA